MKDEIAQLLKSLNETIKAFVKVGEKALQDFGDVFKEEETVSRAEKEQRTSEAERPAKKATPKKQPAKPAKKATKKAGKGKSTSPEEEGSIIGKVQAAIENTPGIEFKALQEKTGLEVKQVRNTLAALKKQGKIKSNGKGIYFPIDRVEKSEMKEEGLA